MSAGVEHGSVPAQMRAIGVRGGKGGADALIVETLPVPVLREGEILIRVEAAGLNRADILQREGRYPPPTGASPVMGLEAAGTVAALARGASRFALGDRVTALLAGGGYAEYVAVDERHALPIPSGLDFLHAGGLPETVFTVWANVFEGGRLARGETFLVHGAGSGIGVTAIQMAKAAGARVLATARGAEKAARARDLGADVAVDAEAGDWAEAVKAAGPVDVILDMVGAGYFARNLDVLGPGGRLVHIATLTGPRVELDLLKLMVRRLSVSGSTLRARTAEEKARLAREVEAKAWPWVADGRVRAIIDRSFPLHEARAAHERLESGAAFGKVMLTMNAEVR